jgi:hypothetical protein
MRSTYQMERNRGTKDARQQLAVLRENGRSRFQLSIKTFALWRSPPQLRTRVRASLLRRRA